MHLHVMIWMWCWKYYINIRVCFCSYSTFSQYRSDLEVDTYIHYSRTLKETSNTVESLNSDYMRGRKEKSGKIHLHCGFHLFFLVCIWTVFFAVFPANWFKRPKKIKYGNSAFSSWSLYSFMLPHFHHWWMCVGYALELVAIEKNHGVKYEVFEQQACVFV